MIKHILSLFILVAILNSCKKDISDPDPIEITVVADNISLLLTANNSVRELYADFTYEGIKYDVHIGRVNPGNENGVVTIENINMISPNSTLSKFLTYSLLVSKPTIPNTISLSISSFIFVYGVGLTGSTGNPLPSDVKNFNKINLQFGSNTEFYIQGWNETFPDNYISKLPEVTDIVQKAAAFINDSDSTVAGNQALPVVISVSK